jgi:hypothetical protein
MEILEYIINEALIIIPVLWILGSFLKKTPRVQDWTIPWVLLVAGMLFAIGIIGFNVDAVVQGVLVAGAAVLGHQLLKQTTNRE